ncbi:hypothetical protein ACTFIY_003164 [Dictyostelium cf. discoideum]
MVIRDQILFHLRIYNNHNNNFDKRRNNISTYNYRKYFSNVCIYEENQEQYNSNRYSISPFVENIEVYTSDIKLGDHWVPDTCKSIIFTSLKSLTFGKSFHHSIHRDEIPPSLTSLLLDPRYKGVIQYGSIPKSVTTLHYSFNSNLGRSILKLGSIPNGTTSLKFDYFPALIVEKGMIPHNVTSLKFDSAHHKIAKDSLPISIKTLHLGSFNSNFNQDVFPQSVTNLSTSYFSDIGKLPKTIEKLKIMGFIPPSSQLDNRSFCIFKNLTSLELELGDEDLTGVEFPSTITRLVLHVSQNFKLNKSFLSNNLKKIVIYNFNQPLNVGDLPSSVEVLKLPKYKQPIQKDVLPLSLTLLLVSEKFNSTIDRHVKLFSIE